MLDAYKILADNITDEDGHGTAVTGIVAARHNTNHGMAGMCPDITLYPVKVELKYSDYPWSIPQHDEYANRISQALNQINSTIPGMRGIKVVILPFACTCDTEVQAENYSSYYFFEVIESLLKDGIIVVTSPDNKNVCPERCYPSALKKLLGTYPNLLIASGCTLTYTNLWGRDMNERFSNQKSADLFAPGEAQHTLGTSSTDAYNIPPDPIGTDMPRLMSGNSLAIPYIGGLAALLFKINPTLTGSEVANIILQTAELQSGGTSQIKVINAFEAALTAYNKKADVKLTGYRIMLPLEYAGGYVVVNGKERLEIFAEPAIWKHSFCRFISSETKIELEVFFEEKLIWKGCLQDILKKSENGLSAWKSSPNIITARLHGLCLKIYNGNENNPIINAKAILQRIQPLYRCTLYEGSTDNSGKLVIPYGEPGQYTLTIIEDINNNRIFETTFDLDIGIIYMTDPRFPNDPDKKSIIFDELGNESMNYRIWTGNISITGIGKPGFYIDGNKKYYDGTFYDASGNISVNVTMKSITKKSFLRNCGEALLGIDFDELFDEDSDEPFNEDDFPDDTIPDYKSTGAFISSEFIYKMKNNFADVPYYDFETEFPCPDEIPNGILLSPPDIDLSLISRNVIQSYIDGNYTECLPYEIDVGVYWYVDSTKYNDYKSVYIIENTRITIKPRIIPIKTDVSPDYKTIRIIAGPCSGKVDFIAHPSLNIEFKTDPEAVPEGFTSVIIENKPQSRSEKIFAIGPRGEIGIL